MKERPILFSAPMVRAILAGTKTQTRRIVKPQFQNGPVDVIDGVPSWDAPTNYGGEVQMNTTLGKPCPHGRPGDKLWVREAWAYGIHALAAARDEDGPFVYAAGGTTQGRLCERWRPSIHMPRWASRITLEITDVRVERLQSISEEDAMAEGASCVDEASGREVLFPAASRAGSFRLGYRCLWESINGPGSWDANPFVWALSFRRLGVEGKE